MVTRTVSFRDENRSPSPQQQRVIELVSAGLTNRDVAEKLGIDPHVVRDYLGVIYDKIGVSIGLNSRSGMKLVYTRGRSPGDCINLKYVPLGFLCC